MPENRHPSLLRREHTALLLVDVQERLHAVMANREPLVENLRRLVRGFQILGMPILVTEQYPQGLGPTIAELRDLLGEGRPIEKLAFSCCQVAELCDQLETLKIMQVVLAGIETHVCILQTALDLLQLGFQVHVPADAVSSRRQLDWQIALERMRQAGVVVTGTESVLFELLVRAGTPEFKEISALVK